ncbi:MAG: TlyA family RNA methyltransferase, partial [Clostridia bacterium]
NVFGLDIAGKTAIDVGASTGGFSDCMLQNGVVKVYAVDVGYGQLAWSLRTDERVVCMERTNIRYVTHEQIPEELGFAVIDVSFISLALVLPPVRALLATDAELICLIKPQFEAGRDKVGKKGVVRDPSVHLEVLQNFLINAKNAELAVKGISFSPITGPEGNIEYLGYLSCAHCEDANIDLAELVEQSHRTLKG